MKKHIFNKNEILRPLLQDIKAIFNSRLVLVIALFLSLGMSSMFAATYTFSGNGNWTSAGNWSPAYPGTTIYAGQDIIINGIVTMNGQVFLDGGTITIGTSGILINDGGFFIYGGTLNNYNILTINYDMVLRNRGGIVNNYASGNVYSFGEFDIGNYQYPAGAQFNNYGIYYNNNNGLIWVFAWGTLNNYGTINNSYTVYNVGIIDSHCMGIYTGEGLCCSSIPIINAPITFYVDSDGDGFGDAAFSAASCTALAGYVTNNTDCDDSNPNRFPGNPEICDGLDNDCDGVIDDGFDNDGDGVSYCNGDCNDNDATIYPGAPELCDGIDNNCDGIIPATEIDNDGDGMTECAGDCDDADVNTYSGAPELCDGKDNDCDGSIDEYFADADGDGQADCVDPDDDNDLIPDEAEFACGSNPYNAASTCEVCDGLDNDGNEGIDEGFADTDGDLIADCVDTDDDNDGVEDINDVYPLNNNLCGDSDGDGCDDCASGTYDPANDGPDQDGDGMCDSGDPDDDNDGISDVAELACGSNPFDASSTCEVCDGVDNDLNEGTDEGFADTDGDLIADCVDTDDDNDGVEDTNDLYPLNKTLCGDSDGDGCDDCASGTYDPANDGPDQDGDGMCDSGDPDDDNDGISDVAELACGSNPFDATSTCEVCDGLDNDGNEGIDEGFADTDGDLIADCLDPDDDNDGVLDTNDIAPFDHTICGDFDGDGCDDCASGYLDPNNDGLDTDHDGICNYGDTDDDGDGVTDIDELACGSDPLSAYSVCEVCDGIDNDLNEGIDEGYADFDGDGQADCVDPDDDNDCILDDDELACGSNPLDGSSTCELCDGIDNDLDGNIDEGFVNTDGDGQADCVDPDDDNDGILDADEIICGSDPLNAASTCEVCDGLDNDGNEGIDEGFADTDGDFMADCVDPDDDNDGVSDVDEITCGSDPLNAASICEICDGVDNDLDGNIDEGFADTDGDGETDCMDSDDDNDGIADAQDNFPLDPTQCQDADGDGCDDCNIGTDGFGPLNDNDTSNDGIDTDGDGICDSGDNCPDLANADQSDLDNNGIGDVCDYQSACAYTVMAMEEVNLDETTVHSGGVGVGSLDKTANIHNYSTVQGNSTFLNADLVDVDNNSAVDNVLEFYTTFAMPTFIPYVAGNGVDVTVEAGDSVVLAGNQYKTLNLKKNAIVLFSGHTTVYVEEIKTKDGSRLYFDQCSNIITQKGLNFDKNVKVNSDDAYVVSFYTEKGAKIKEGSVINANIYALDDIDIEGKEDNPVNIKGLMATDKKFKSKKYVNLYFAGDCGVACPPNAPLIGNNPNIIQTNQNAVFGFEIYPNPGDGKVTIELGRRGRENVSVSITNVFGQVVYTGETKDKSIQIDFTDTSYASGVYYVEIDQAGEKMTKKLIISK